MSVSRKMFICCISLLCTIFTSGCVYSRSNADDTWSVEGYVIAVNDEIYFIIFDNIPHSMFSVPHTTELFAGIVKTGDKVSVTIDSIQDTNPPMVGVSAITVLEEGHLHALPADVLDIVKGLENMGWFIN